MTVNNAAEPTMPDHAEKEAIEYVQNLKGFYMHMLLYAFIMPCLFVLNLVISPDDWWFLYVLIAWLAGLAIHAVAMFGMFGLLGANWEQREFRKRMNRYRN